MKHSLYICAEYMSMCEYTHEYEYAHEYVYISMNIWVVWLNLETDQFPVF